MLKKLSLIALSLILALTLIPNASAENTMRDFFSGNDILYYDPEFEDMCIPTSYGSVNLVGNDNAEKIWNFLIDKGLTDNQAAGIMGNLRQESNYNPSAVESNGIGYGIAQWSFGRRTALENAAAREGVPVDDLSFQLNFMYEESMSRRAPMIYGGGNEWETLKQQDTMHDALVYWHDAFERSADSRSKVITVRGGYAQDALNSFGGTTTSGAEPCSSASQVPAGTQHILSTIRKFAWPYSTMGMKTNSEAKEAYQSAAGRHFPGGYGPYTYADCTYFVATVMRDSGADANFPIGTTAIRSYLLNNTDKYEIIHNPTMDDLQPGDILQHVRAGSSAAGSWQGHIMFYTGNALDSSGKYVAADASKYTRVPGYLEQPSVNSMLAESTAILARLKW